MRIFGRGSCEFSKKEIIGFSTGGSSRFYQEVQGDTNRNKLGKHGMKLTICRSARTGSRRAEETKLEGTNLEGLRRRSRVLRRRGIVALR